MAYADRTDLARLALNRAALAGLDIAAPAAPSVARAASAGSLSAGVYSYACAFVTSGGETEAGEVSDTVTIADPAVAGRVTLSDIPCSDNPDVTARKLYRTAHDGTTRKLVATISDNTTTEYTDNVADASLGANAPTANSTGQATLDAALEAASDLADSYLRARYTLPLSDWQDDLTLAVCQIAAYRAKVARGYDPDAAGNGNLRQGYDDAIAWLKGVASGSLMPDVTDSSTEGADESAGIVHVYTSARRGW